MCADSPIGAVLASPPVAPPFAAAGPSPAGLAHPALDGQGEVRARILDVASGGHEDRLQRRRAEPRLPARRAREREGRRGHFHEGNASEGAHATGRSACVYTVGPTLRVRALRPVTVSAWPSRR
jgi:hypothetical protein